MDEERALELVEQLRYLLGRRHPSVDEYRGRKYRDELGMRDAVERYQGRYLRHVDPLADPRFVVRSPGPPNFKSRGVYLRLRYIYDEKRMLYMAGTFFAPKFAALVDRDGGIDIRGYIPGDWEEKLAEAAMLAREAEAERGS
jgi:hypothetical protein